MLEGTTFSSATVSVTGGALPARTASAADGAFTVEVALAPGTLNRLRVTSTTDKRGSKPVTVMVRQQTAGAAGKVKGTVRDIETGLPMAGAKVAYGTQAVISDAQGGFQLTDLPEGVVVATASAPGFLGGVASATVDQGTAEDLAVLLQKLATPVPVTQAGGTFSGPGWKLEVPRNALSRTTGLQFTQLTFTGTEDSYGLPFVDLSPSGQRFAKPVTVTIDPSAVGIEAADAELVGVDPATGATSVLPSRVVGGQLVTTLTEFAGLKLFSRDRHRRAPDVEPDGWCKPYSSTVRAGITRAMLQVSLLPYLRVKIGEGARRLWSEYLAGGVPSRTRQVLGDSEFLEAYRDDQDSKDAMLGVFDQLVGRVGAVARPALAAPESPTTQQLSDFPDLGQHLYINYSDPDTLTGNTAGGISDSSVDTGSQHDDRSFSGSVKYVPSASSRGVLTKVDLVAELKLTVKDSIDFCPGGWGSVLEQSATIPLSRLEKTPEGAGKYAKPLLFEVNPVFEPQKRDVTTLFEPNDADGDGVPDAQPWTGASYTLDNCPDMANPGQADSDGDGLGDVCDPTEEEPPTTPVVDGGPADPGSGGSSGDPHLVTFDGGRYDFQAVGDYVIAKGEDDFEIQARYTRLPGSSPTVAFNRGVAARVGPSVIAFNDDEAVRFGGPSTATLDGQPLSPTTAGTALPGGAIVRLDSGGPVVRWPDGTTLVVGSTVGSPMSITLAPARWGHVRGLYGNADRSPANDLATADGTVTSLEQLYDVFGTHWRRSGDGSFFRTSIPADGALPVDPPSRASLADLTPEQRAAAEAVCRAHGVTAGPAFIQCVLDVALTGDARYADDAAAVGNRMAGTTDLGALVGRLESTSALQLGRQADGSLDSAGVYDVFTVDLGANDAVRLTAPGPCTRAGTFTTSLIAPSGRVVATGHGPGCGGFAVTGLVETGRYQVRVSDSGGFTGAYAIRLDRDRLGTTCQASQVAANDDGSSPEVPMPFEIDFFGRTHRSFWVNNNGNITFDGPVSAYTPESLDAVSRSMVAVWWADVDTRGALTNPVHYGLGEVGGRRAICVDFDHVGYYSSHDDKLNSFQLYIVDRGDVAPGAFDIVLRYTRLQWETGDASGGTGGLGGVSAGVGYTNGTRAPGTYLDLAGSRVPGSFLDGSPGGLVGRSTSSGEAGLHIFPIR